MNTLKLPKTKARTQGVAPFAYDTDAENKVFVRNEAKYKILKEVVEGIVAGSIKSIREGRLFVEAKGYSISVQSLSKYVKDEREAVGNKGKYHYSTAQKAKNAAKKSLRDKQKKVDALDKKLRAAKASLTTQTKIQNKLDEPKDVTTVTGKVVTE